MNAIDLRNLTSEQEHVLSSGVPTVNSIGQEEPSPETGFDRIYKALKNETNADVLALHSKNPNLHVRVHVACNPNTSPEVLVEMLWAALALHENEPSGNVLTNEHLVKVIAMDERLPQNALVRFAEQRNRSIYRANSSEKPFASFAKAILQNESADEDMQEKMLAYLLGEGASEERKENYMYKLLGQ